MQANPLPPALRQRRRFVVRRDDAVDMRQAEERQHRQVGLAVTSVRGRVHQIGRTRGRPHDVAGPQVAVQPSRRFGRYADVPDPIHHPLDGSGVRRGHPPGVHRMPDVGKHPPPDVELRP